MRWFKITNLERYQHYKERSPPWVKLYQNFIDDYDLARLGDAGRFHFAACILLASRSGNRLPWDAEWLRLKMSGGVAPDLDMWLELSLISTICDDASKPLADCATTNESVLERAEESRGEGETEKRRDRRAARAKKPRVPPDPAPAMIEALRLGTGRYPAKHLWSAIQDQANGHEIDPAILTKHAAAWVANGWNRTNFVGMIRYHLEQSGTVSRRDDDLEEL